MGAGQKQDHWIQDGCEIYFVAKLQEELCNMNFNITFMLTEITNIKGEKGHPFFKWVKKEAGFLAFPKWNFYKYLINKEGLLVKWYASTTRPNSNKITTEIDKIILK